MYQVQKRDGTIAEFEISKISAAIQKSFNAREKQSHPSVIDMLALRVTSAFKNGDAWFPVTVLAAPPGTMLVLDTQRDYGRTRINGEKVPGELVARFSPVL